MITLGEQMGTGFVGEGRTLSAHLSLITSNAECGTFEINWLLQRKCF